MAKKLVQRPGAAQAIPRLWGNARIRSGASLQFRKREKNEVQKNEGNGSMTLARQGLLAGKEGQKNSYRKGKIPPGEKGKEKHLSPKASKPCKIERSLKGPPTLPLLQKYHKCHRFPRGKKMTTKITQEWKPKKCLKNKQASLLISKP